MALFSNAHDINISGGTFNAINNINNVNEDSEFGLYTLKLAVSLGAIHDSGERYPAPNCHLNTRKAVRKIILDWVHWHKESSTLPVFWLYGPLGVGKTAILQAIAEFLCSESEYDENSSLGGSFFFSRRHHGRDRGDFLFSTIAYQLALNVPGLRQHVNRIMEINPTLHTKSMVVQLKKLIVDALKCLPLPQRSYLVIIDGLDECQDKATQQSILSLLCEAITVYKLPLRFLIASRPESHIRASFDRESLYKITRRVVLDESFNPGRDIEMSLQDGFAEIYAMHAEILSHVEQPWPAQGIIDLLVQRSCGQFIYAATVLKFVGADLYDPTEQLAHILKLDSTAFTDLDQLYTHILSVYPKRENLVQVLGILMAFDTGTLTPETIADILGMKEMEVKLVLRCLSSVIAFVGDKHERYGVFKDSNIGSVYLVHASFGDYLVDLSRSGPFHVDKQEHKNRATILRFARIIECFGNSWRIPSTKLRLHGKTWDHIKTYLPDDFIHCPEVVRDAIMMDIDNLLQEFWKTADIGAVDVRRFTLIRLLLDILRVPAKGGEMNQSLDVCQTGKKSEIFRVCHGYEKMLDQCFISAFSKARPDIGDLRLLTGIVVQKSLTMQGMADLYGVEVDQIKLLSQWAFRTYEVNIQPSTYTPSTYTLEGDLSAFLRDSHRSQLYYCDPVLHHVFICRRFLSLLDESTLQSNDLPAYLQSHLYQHLFAATKLFFFGRNISDDHPAIEILNDLERITCYHPGTDQSDSISYLAQHTIWGVVRWVDMLNNRLKGMTGFIFGVNLIERLRRITDRIFRQIIRIEKHGDMTTITLCAPLRAIAVHSMRLETPLCETANPGVVQISWELLAQVSVKGRISSSFADFITTPERSGPLSVSLDVCDTIIKECSVGSMLRDNNPFMYSDSGPFSKQLLASKFRILCVGRSGAGKSSLINLVFGIDKALVSHIKAGEPDVDEKFSPEQKKFFVLHDSKGFEPGNTTALDIVTMFISKRCKKKELKDRLHAIWLCTETPTAAGGQVFEEGDEILVKLAQEKGIPIVIVFTQYDRLVKAKIGRLRAKNNKLTTLEAQKQGETEAARALDDCVKYIEGSIMKRLKISMPRFANVSVHRDYKDNVSKLVEITCDVVQNHLKNDAWLMWAIAQRVSLPLKINACIEIIVSCYHMIHIALSGIIPDVAGKVLLREFLAGLHKNIVSCWNLEDHDQLLNSAQFKQLMLSLVQGIQEESTQYMPPDFDRISEFLALLTAAPAPVASPVATLELSDSFVKWVSDAVLDNTPSILRVILAYTVDLNLVLKSIFKFMPKSGPMNWEVLKEAFEDYESSHDVRQIHNSCRSIIKWSKQDLDGDAFRVKIREMFRED